MGKVINLSENKPIPPKSETITHEGQRFTVTYDPNAPEHERWVWKLNYVVTYEYFGSQPTIETARQRAKRMITSLNQKEYFGE
jgi:hypothetical protein